MWVDVNIQRTQPFLEMLLLVNLQTNCKHKITMLSIKLKCGSNWWTCRSNYQFSIYHQFSICYQFSISPFEIYPMIYFIVIYHTFCIGQLFFYPTIWSLIDMITQSISQTASTLSLIFGHTFYAMQWPTLTDHQYRPIFPFASSPSI